jgi:predicted TIM-barrel fold metal-dependent hydrolase
MDRRTFLHGSVSTGAALIIPHPAGVDPRRAVIDAHIHLYDPTRPGGVPWPERTDSKIYKTELPGQFQAAFGSLPVVGAIVIEASPLAADNDWILAVAKRNPLLLGLIGDLVPGAPDYLPSLDRLHQNSLFLGIRYGNLWGRDLATDLGKPAFLEGLWNLSQAGLVFESANPDARLVQALAELAEKMPDQRIVIDHLPNANLPDTSSVPTYVADLRRLAQVPHVFIKFSEILTEDTVQFPERLTARYRKLDELWEIFGEDKILYGSDWPNSNHAAQYREIFNMMDRYLASKDVAAREKVFWSNSYRAYRWQPRTVMHRQLVQPLVEP